MKILPFLFILLPILVIGQQSEILSSSKLNARATINLANGELLNVTSSDGLQLSLQNSELSIKYTLPELGEEGRFYEVIPSIKLNGEDLLIIPHEEFRGDWNQVLLLGEKELLWIDLQQKYVQLIGSLEVGLTVHRWGEKKLPYDCSLGAPQFTSKQRLPYYIAAGVGAASIGLGQIFKSQSQSTYDEYLSSSTLAEASPKYEDANSKNKTYLLLTYIGAGILVADVTLFIFRQRKYKKKKSLYDQYCTEPDLGAVPSLNLSTGFVDGGPGLKIKMNF